MASTNWGDRAKSAKNAFQAIPVNNYDVIVESAEHKVASTGNEMFALTFVVEGGPYDGKKLFTNLVYTENAAGFFFGKMKALGLEADFFVGKDATEICAALIDARATVKTKHREYQGEIRSEVDRITARSGASGIPEPSEVRSAAVGAAPPRPF